MIAVPRWCWCQTAPGLLLTPPCWWWCQTEPRLLLTSPCWWWCQILVDADAGLLLIADLHLTNVIFLPSTLRDLVLELSGGIIVSLMHTCLKCAFMRSVSFQETSSARHELTSHSFICTSWRQRTLSSSSPGVRSSSSSSSAVSTSSLSRIRNFEELLRYELS